MIYLCQLKHREYKMDTIYEIQKIKVFSIFSFAEYFKFTFSSASGKNWRSR